VCAARQKGKKTGKKEKTDQSGKGTCWSPYTRTRREGRGRVPLLGESDSRGGRDLPAYEEEGEASYVKGGETPISGGDRKKVGNCKKKLEISLLNVRRHAPSAAKRKDGNGSVEDGRETVLLRKRKISRKNKNLGIRKKGGICLEGEYAKKKGILNKRSRLNKRERAHPLLHAFLTFLGGKACFGDRKGGRKNNFLTEEGRVKHSLL